MKVKFEDPSSAEETVEVGHIPLKHYEKAFLASDDELELCAIAIGKSKSWVMGLAPESYEDLMGAIREVNAKGFFAYASRRQEAVINRMNKVSPEVLRLAAEKGSTITQPGLRPQ